MDVDFDEGRPRADVGQTEAPRVTIWVTSNGCSTSMLRLTCASWGEARRTQLKFLNQSRTLNSTALTQQTTWQMQTVPLQRKMPQYAA
jgi:hypothetical protein